MRLRECFQSVSSIIFDQLHAQEVALCYFQGEDSNFIRFNHARVRQAGHVLQATLRVELIARGRHASASLTLAGEPVFDGTRVTEILGRLRGILSELPEDPHLLYNDKIESSERIDATSPENSGEHLEQIIHAAQGLDLVGIYAGGMICEGFSNSLGQINWLQTRLSSLDWSLYNARKKAVKCSYATKDWKSSDFQLKINRAREQLKLLEQPPIQIVPGNYRVYLAPPAFKDFFEVLAWGGFGLKEQKTRSSALMRLVDGKQQLHPSVHVSENIPAGLSADFQEQGFTKVAHVPIIQSGRHAGCMISPRSAKEFGVDTNGAGASEAPVSLDMQGGELEAPIEKMLGDGIYINHVWYLNYSDRNACRITGMTRFACFWVEKGEIKAPIDAMRFDESLYRMLGDKLAGLTRERELLVDTSTYERRSTSSLRLPGALVDDFPITL